MKLARHNLAAILAKLSLANGLDKASFGREIAAYLLEAGRTGELDSLLRDVVNYRAANGIVEVSAFSSHELGSGELEQIERIVRQQFKNAKTVIINQRIDLDVIGGVRLELVDKLLDLSVEAKLDRFRQLTTNSERT